MKSPRYYFLPALALAAFAPSAWAEKEVIIRRLDTEGPQGPHHGVVVRKGDAMMEKEKVTFLGVETAPASRTLSAQLGLMRDTGLVITHIADKSPAAEVLKEDDVLLRFDDQILVNQQQLGVLVRAKKEGDEVKLTVVRGGKELSVKAKLATHEVPKLTSMFPGAPGGFGWNMAPPSTGIARMEQLPGMDGEHVRDVLRMIGRDHQNLLATPGVRIFRSKGKGSTILDLPNSNISYSDDEGSIEIKADDGQRTLKVKDAKGKVTFEGPINTDEERKQLPPEVMQQLKKLDDDTISFEAGEKFEHEVLPLPTEPAKSRISHEVGRPAVPSLRSF
ncbi:MAG: PDZ domain-containing protein [Opitutae bacterium]|nr:PDZ domain-containing protein [Opitutae bacterium]